MIIIEWKTEKGDIFGLEKGSYFGVSRKGGVLFRCITVSKICLSWLFRVVVIPMACPNQPTVRRLSHYQPTSLLFQVNSIIIFICINFKTYKSLNCFQTFNTFIFILYIFFNKFYLFFTGFTSSDRKMRELWALKTSKNGWKFSTLFKNFERS